MTKFTCFQYKYAIQLATLKAFETRLFCHFSYIMLIKGFRYLLWGILGLGLISPVRLDGRQDIQTLKLINLYSELKNKESQKSFLLGLTTNNPLKEHINHFVQPVTSFTPAWLCIECGNIQLLRKLLCSAFLKNQFDYGSVYGCFVQIQCYENKKKNYFELFFKVINLIRSSLKDTPYKMRSGPSLRYYLCWYKPNPF